MEAEISNENSKSISQNKINQLEIKNSNDGQSGSIFDKHY